MMLTTSHRLADTADSLLDSTVGSLLRAVLSGGSSVPAELVRRIESTLGISFCIVFGQTETSPVITQTKLDDSSVDKAETIGRPHPWQEVKVPEGAPQVGLRGRAPPHAVR